MYHPYFRGKQYELITIREMAQVLKNAGFRPIVEPVRETLAGLRKALDAIVEIDGRAILVVNPHHGDMSKDGTSLTQMLRDDFPELPGISAGILLKPGMTPDEAIHCYEIHAEHSPVLIHAGFSDAKALAEKLGQPSTDQWHVFFNRFCGRLYQKHFKGSR
jgi:hypothetical protein